MNAGLMPEPRRWWAGAYALTASLGSFSEQDATAFYQALQELPLLAGLELPVHRLETADDPWRHLQLLPRDLDYVLTPLPAVMQSLQQQPLFGLASPDPEGRAAALQGLDEIRIRIQRLNDHCGRSAVRVLELHSAPTGQASALALRRSLDTLRGKDWQAVELWLEHCDAYRPGQKPAKGFLDIDAEITLCQEFGLGMNINWGRSVLETRRPEAAEEHLQKAQKAGVLRGFFLSGVTVDDPVYGSWLDNHAPMQWSDQARWMPTASLLTQEAARACLQSAQQAAYWGLKIQPGPATLPWEERVQCLRQHLEILSRLLRA